MIRVPITWVDEPSRPELESDAAVPERLLPFVEAVGREAGVTIQCVTGFLREVAPANGIVLLNASAHPTVVLDECGPDVREDLARRLVPITIDRHRIFETILEELSVAAAVDGLSLAEWSVSQGRTGAWGPHGLRDIGALVGARCVLYESARYCYLQSATHNGLPHLLADYLTVYAEKVLLGGPGSVD